VLASLVLSTVQFQPLAISATMILCCSPLQPCYCPPSWSACLDQQATGERPWEQLGRRCAVSDAVFGTPLAERAAAWDRVDVSGIHNVHARGMAQRDGGRDGRHALSERQRGKVALHIGSVFVAGHQNLNGGAHSIPARFCLPGCECYAWEKNSMHTGCTVLPCV
jgi:hypothetical protein